jgi:hypothetical protein
MGGFTRLLHSGEADDLMDEVPTFVAQPLPNSVVEHEAYPVLNRPYAFLQWIKASNITEDYILMSEPDHIFLRPIPNLMRKDSWPAAYPFFYIEPAKVRPKLGCSAGGLPAEGTYAQVAAYPCAAVWLLYVWRGCCPTTTTMLCTRR